MGDCRRCWTCCHLGPLWLWPFWQCLTLVKPQVSLLWCRLCLSSKSSAAVFFFFLRWHVYFCRPISHFFLRSSAIFSFWQPDTFFSCWQYDTFFLSDTLIFQGGYIILWKYGTLTFYTCFSFCLLASEDPYIKPPRACTNLYKQPWVGSMIL